VATLASNTELKPVHMGDGVAVTVTVGKAFIVSGTCVMGPKHLSVLSYSAT
jgi:7-keto-8-aminopelargonate synthetase-like enzyme